MGSYDTGCIVQTILTMIKENGPMTVAQIAQESGIRRALIHGTVGRMREPTVRPPMPKRLYVIDWIYDQEGARVYPRPLLAIGNKPDKKRPPRNKSAVAKRYREAVKAKFKGNSVFNLGLSNEAIRLMRMNASIDPAP